VDQAAPANQEVLRNHRKRRQDSDLDRRFRLCSGRHSEKTSPIRGESLHNSTDFERDDFRENLHFTGVHEQCMQNRRSHVL